MPPRLIHLLGLLTCLVAAGTTVLFALSAGPADSRPITDTAGVAPTARVAPATGGKSITGLLKLTAGKATTHGSGVTVTGTYFRMITPAGPGHYFPNPATDAGKSSAAETYTLLAPGSDGGLKLGNYQAPPSPAFSGPNARASDIVLPEKFVSPKFSISTAANDAQAHVHDTAPSLVLNGTKITGNLEAWTAEWNDIYFNQGSPKPGADAYPGLTRPVTGTYDPKTRGFVITWYSLIVGGPFNGFTGYWHLQGTLAK